METTRAITRGLTATLEIDSKALGGSVLFSRTALPDVSLG